MRKDTNLILNELIQGENFTVRQDTNALINALYDGSAVLQVNVTNLPPAGSDENNNIDLGTGNTFTKTVTTADVYVAVEGGFQMKLVDSLDTNNFCFTGDITADLSTGMLFTDLQCSESGEEPWEAVGIKVVNFSYDSDEGVTYVNFTDNIEGSGSWQKIYDWGSWVLDEATFVPGTSTTTQFEQCIVASDNVEINSSKVIAADGFVLTSNVRLINTATDLSADNSNVYVFGPIAPIAVSIRTPEKNSAMIYLVNVSAYAIAITYTTNIGTSLSVSLAANTAAWKVESQILIPYDQIGHGEYRWLRIN